MRKHLQRFGLGTLVGGGGTAALMLLASLVAHYPNVFTGLLVAAIFYAVGAILLAD